jgi:hypothetical protein
MTSNRNSGKKGRRRPTGIVRSETEEMNRRDRKNRERKKVARLETKTRRQR